jgi:TRAP-type transport system small permease protein
VGDQDWIERSRRGDPETVAASIGTVALDEGERPLHRIALIYRAFMVGLRLVVNLALVSLVLVVLAAVAVRYTGILSGSLDWASEYSRFGIIWVVMLGAAIAFDQGAHVAIDFTDKMPASMRRAARTIGYICGVGFVAILAWQGFRLSFATMRQISPALGIPVGYAYLAIPVGAVIMTMQSLLFAAMPELQERRPSAEESGA